MNLETVIWSKVSQKEKSKHHALTQDSRTLATSCEELTHWKRLWCWEGLGAGREGDDRGWDGWMASLTWWMWVWVNSGSWWWTGRPGVLWFMGSQWVGHDWATELNWTESSDKEPACQCRRHKRWGFDPCVGRIPLRRAWQPTPVFLPGESHGQKTLVGNSSEGYKESEGNQRLAINMRVQIHTDDNRG